MREQTSRLVDKGICLAVYLLYLIGVRQQRPAVIPFLILVIYLSLSLYFTKKVRIFCLGVVFLAASWYWKSLLFFVPFLLYDLFWFHVPHCLWIYLAEVFLSLVFLWNDGGELSLRGMDQGTVLLLFLYEVLAAGLAGYLYTRTRMLIRLRSDYVRQQDQDREERRIFQQRQQELLERQDYEIHVATLTERNRIAREIHDNVGHMLSRAILQMGALQTIHPEEPLHSQLTGVGDTLSEAMTQIRESVHDLHNESLDLQQALEGLLSQLPADYHARLEYDLTASVPRNVKYCFLSICRESLANVMKHSTADQIYVLTREHPGFYQLFVEDKGAVGNLSEDSGIGLVNMQERVKALGGTIHFRTGEGFRITVSIPKDNKGADTI